MLACCREHVVVLVVRVCVCGVCGVLFFCVCVYMWCWVLVFCVCTCGVGEAWHAENPPVCTFKTPPCALSGRLRVYRQQARMSILNVHTGGFSLLSLLLSLSLSLLLSLVLSFLFSSLVLSLFLHVSFSFFLLFSLFSFLLYLLFHLLFHLLFLSLSRHVDVFDTLTLSFLLDENILGK